MLQALSNYNKTSTQQCKPRGDLCVVYFCASIWSDMLQGGNKCKSHIAQSLSEYSIKHIFKPGRNTKVITLQVFQLGQSSFHAFRGCEQDIQDCSGAISSQFIQRASNPWADRSCPRRYFLSPWKMPAVQESWIYRKVSRLAASTGLSKQVSQTTAFPSEQTCPAWAAVSGWVMAPHPGKLLYRFPGIHEGLEIMQMLSGPGDIPFACQCTHLGVPNTYILEQRQPRLPSAQSMGSILPPLCCLLNC